MLLKICFVLFLACVCRCDKPHVKTPLGEVRGSTRTSHGGRTYSAFEGIPYAKPPTGERRFEEPEPVEPWDGVWDANLPSVCAQTIFQNMTAVGEMSEDCLHVNVYVPRETPNSGEKLEVVVHIHGGAYMFGSGHGYAHPQYFMDHDVILVTFNYRVGLLGFLSTEDDVVPGNNGMKDQVLALKWIQENIASFGGNPGSVTLTGLSAGGSSVHLHYFSELSKGLFHRGFSQSGVALNSFSLQEGALTKAKILAEAVGCPTTPSRSLVQCLKQRPYQQLLVHMHLFYSYLMFPFAPFAPVVEKGTKAFLKEDPYILLTQGKINDVPWITSNTIHEGFFPVMYIQDQLETINEKWEDLVQFLLDFDRTLPQSLWKSAGRKIKEFYFPENQKISRENFISLIKVFSDRIFLVDAETAVKEQAKVATSPIYYYLMGYPGDNNELGIVSHGGDASYFFRNVFTNQPLTTNELQMKDLLMEMIISYAKTGKPVVKGVNWEPTQHDKLTYLDITGFNSEDIKLQEIEELTPRAFWKSLGIQENENLISPKDEL